ncbi:MAG: glycosyltransferase [Chitinophagales bacterium]
MEITVFTNGDSADISTWSNVPYFFTETLISKGVKVNRVNIRTSKILKTLYRISIWQILKRTKKHDAYEYYRTKIHDWHINFKIKNAVKKYPHSDAFLFLSFSFSAKKYSSKPTILFGDWTFDHYFNYFKNRKPGSLENEFVERENEHIEKADLVFVLFPKVAEYMKVKYKNSNIYYIGNVINSKIHSDESEILAKKKKSNKILFIGSSKYKSGADVLLKAFVIAQQKNPDLELHFIGLKDSDFDHLPQHVFCHGYLNKATESERKLYYDLLESAKMYVNTTSKWSAFSATIEAMYFYNPILISPYDEFSQTFGETNDFVNYSSDNNAEILANDIITLYNHPNYTEICRHTHAAVKSFTWESYIDQFLKITNDYIEKSK